MQLRSAGLPITAQSICNPPQEIEKSTIFRVLRALHAPQAAVLAEQSWEDPISGGVFHLFDDLDIRAFFGQLIGRVAYSHHWDIERVSDEIPTQTGVSPDFPADWSFSPVRIACLLRCSDAAHIDRRRAPTMDYALLAPKGISGQHWRFQNHLAAPRRDGVDIVYTTGRDFGRSEADAWWLCYDTCKMISKELEQCDGLLQEKGLERFAARGVAGVVRPKPFSTYVRCSGWEPVDAEIKASDPITLAQTLGGINLYGKGFHAPIRELLQNAIDATRLRITSREKDYQPLVRLTLKKNKSDTGYVIVVEDNGIGMSTRVLTTSLIDFGRSLWRGESLYDEYPELRLSETDTAGKFGIGFFSAFLMGDKVSVTSRKYDRGVADAMTLEFTGLDRRPLLRRPEDSETSTNFNTSVLIHISDEMAYSGILPNSESEISSGEIADLFEYIRFLTSSAVVNIEFVDEIGDRSFVHSSAWESMSSEEFLKGLFPVSPFYDEDNYDADDEDELNPEESMDRFLLIYADLLTDIQDRNGKTVGRAAITLSDRDMNSELISVGGLTYPINRSQNNMTQRNRLPSYVGILPGDAAIATRSAGSSLVNPEMLSRWSTGQAATIARANASISEKMHVAHAVFYAGGDPGALPVGLLRGNLVSHEELKQFMMINHEIYLLIDSRGEDSLVWSGMASSSVDYILEELAVPVFIQLGNRWGQRVGIDGPVYDEGRKRVSPEIARNVEFGVNRIVTDTLTEMGKKWDIYTEYTKIISSGREPRDPRSCIVLVF
jgi:hypothetical protein